MKSIVLGTLILAFPSISYACTMSPFYSTAINSEEFLKEYDVMFLGRLDSEVTTQGGREQIAQFTVLKPYKGKVSGSVVVNNKLTSSCSRLFEAQDSEFYVFANTTRSQGVYEIPGFASFVPKASAIKYQWSPE